MAVSVITVTVGGLGMSDGPHHGADGDGCVWILNEIEGWWGGLDVRASPADRRGQDGTYDVGATFSGRTVTIKGTVVAQDRNGLQAAMDRVAGILSGAGRAGTLTVAEASRGITRTAAVRLGGPTIVSRLAVCTAEFSISLYAPSPDRLGTHRSVSAGSNATAGLTNEGDRNAWPVISLAGSLSNPSVAIAGRTLSIAGQVPAGSTLRIDTATRAVLLDGVSRRDLLRPGSTWPFVPPGASSVRLTADAGAGTATLDWNDRWS